MPFLQVHGISLVFRLCRNVRTKRLQMRLKRELFEVIAPLNVKNQVILDFIWHNQRWMVKQWQRRQSFIPMLANFAWPAQFQAGEIFPYRAQGYRLNLKYGSDPLICLQTESLRLVLPWQQTRAEEIATSITSQLLAWYHQEALSIIKKTIECFCPRLGRWPQSVQLKQQKTRWGSCSSKQKININWLLILAPPGVLEYVVIHELCHLFYRNHGPRFWAKVATCLPNYHQYDEWLARYGQMLMPVREGVSTTSSQKLKLVF